MSEKQDQKDINALADVYLDAKRCLGGRLVHQNYQCLHCGSDDPSTLCHSKKLKYWKVNPNDWLDVKERKKIAKYMTVGQDPRTMPVKLDYSPRVSSVFDCPQCASVVEVPGVATAGIITKCGECQQLIEITTDAEEEL